MGYSCNMCLWVISVECLPSRIASIIWGIVANCNMCLYQFAFYFFSISNMHLICLTFSEIKLWTYDLVPKKKKVINLWCWYALKELMGITFFFFANQHNLFLPSQKKKKKKIFLEIWKWDHFFMNSYNGEVENHCLFGTCD